jgi:GDPmannose 4,6-dehydratase
MKKIALITGITGQDGSYLAELLLSKNYIVHGVKRRTSLINTARIDHIYQSPSKIKKNFFLHYGDMTDSLSLLRIFNLVKPDEIYNLAAQSHVAVSFEEPEYTANSDALGTLRLLEIINSSDRKNKIKFYQAGTSELFGKTVKSPQDEKTPFYPRSPYGVAKLYAHWITINYREAYNIFACNGILFNHESPRRGETFVTKKIINGLCKISLGYQDSLVLGNLYAKRDWGHAKDYVLAMWKILQQKKPNDFIVATGKQYSIKQFISLVLKELNMKVRWVGKGINEKAYDKNGKCIIKIDKRYFRPTEVESLLGSSKKAFKYLNWKPKYNILSLVKEMISSELHQLKK